VDSVGESITDRNLNAEQENQLLQLQQGCHDVLKEIEALLFKYRSLGTNRIRKWKWIGWGREKVPDIRQRLNTSVAMLTSFNTTIVT
jgi:hypothetical protein